MWRKCGKDREKSVNKVGEKCEKALKESVEKLWTLPANSGQFRSNWTPIFNKKMHFGEEYKRFCKTKQKK